MSIFHFKEFSIRQDNSILKVGTDAMVLGSLVNSEKAKQILDIGTGTGVLALMMAQKYENAKLTAVEIDVLSADDCEFNFKSSPWNKRLEVIVKNILDFEAENKFDLIICNPPFYSNSLANEDQRKASAKHTAYLPFEELFKKVVSLLFQEGQFWMILPFQDKEIVRKIAVENGLFPKTDVTVNSKLNQPVRTVFCFTTTISQTMEKDAVTIRKSDNSYTEEYKILTADFHGVQL